MRRTPWLLLGLAAALRALVCLRTEVPGRDGVSYLWMAEQVAAGRLAALFETVFHPLYPALVALLLAIAPGLDAMRAGQIVASGLGALAIVPLWAVTRSLFGERAALWAGVAYAAGAWFSRHPAECLSEGPFYLAVTSWAWAMLAPPRPRAAVAGCAAAAAYLLRPEGVLLVLLGAGWLVRRRARADAVRLLAVALPVMALLPLGHATLGDGFTLTPKATFNYDVGIGQAASPMRHYLTEASKLPLAAAEELGWLMLPLVLVGVLRDRARSWRDGGALLLLPFALQCLVVPLLRTHWRFLSGFGVLLLPYAATAILAILAASARRHRLLPWLFLALLAAAEARIVGARHRDRAIERDLGRQLRGQLAAGDTVATDMPRLAYYAGQRPPPPRPILPVEILAQARRPECRFVALVAGRTEVTDTELRALGLEPVELEGLLSAPIAPRLVRLYAKSRTR